MLSDPKFSGRWVVIPMPWKREVLERRSSLRPEKELLERRSGTFCYENTPAYM
jgi:hypothetical protein